MYCTVSKSRIHRDHMSTESKPIPVLNWPNDLPEEGDSFFSIFCDSQDLCWVFHKPDGTMIQWRTTYITEVDGDDLMNDLVLLFPPDSEPLKYIFGSENRYTLQSALKQSKLHKSSSLYVYYLDDSIEINKQNEFTDEEQEQQRRNETYASQLNMLANIWSAIPCCKGYKVDINTFIGSSDTLSLEKDMLKRLSSQTIATYILADVHFPQQQIITFTKSRRGELSYIGSFELGSDNNDNRNDVRKVITAGTLRQKKSNQKQDDIINELDKVLTRWKSNMQNTNGIGNKDSIPALIVGNDRNYDLQSHIQSMLLRKSNKPLYDFSHFPCPIAYGMDHVVAYGRERAEQMEKEQEVAERLEKSRLRAERREKVRVARQIEKEKETAERQEKKTRVATRESFTASQKKRGREALKKNKQLEEERTIKAEEAKRKSESKRRKKSDKPNNAKADSLGTRKKAGEAKRKSESKRRKKSDKSKKAKADPRSFIGAKIAKKFADGVFTGKVTAYFDEEESEEALWHVVYEDNDKEDLNEKELFKAIDLFKKTK